MAYKEKKIHTFFIKICYTSILIFVDPIGKFRWIVGRGDFYGGKPKCLLWTVLYTAAESGTGDIAMVAKVGRCLCETSWGDTCRTYSKSY